MKEVLFGIGDLNESLKDCFDGNSYCKTITKEAGPILNVTFEPGCRNHWHIHHNSMQILMVTNGDGYFQKWGEEVQYLKPGDIVYIEPETKHWHGAAKDNWFTHLSVEVPSEGAYHEWLEAVDEDFYNNL